MKWLSNCRTIYPIFIALISCLIIATGAGAGSYAESKSGAARGAAADSIIALMVAGVSQDSIYNFLAKLSGEDPVGIDYPIQTIRTRYSSTRGAEVAADYLRQMFERYGYTVEYQHFQFGSNMQAMMIGSGGTGFAVGQSSRVLKKVGGAWEDVRVGTDTTTALLLDVDHAEGDNYIIVGKKGTVLTSDDEGTTWIERSSGGTVRLNGVDVVPGGSGWIVGSSGTILHSSTGGATWAPQASGVASILQDVWAFDELTAVVVGNLGVILLTSDGGVTWNPVTSPTSNDLLAIDCVGNHMRAVGDAGTIIVSNDAGATWSLESSGTTDNLTDISLFDSTHGWVVGGGPSLGIIMNLNGTIWTSQTTPFPDFTLMGVSAVSASEAFAVGLTGAVIHTSDAGSNWTSYVDSVKAGMANVVASKNGTTAPDEVVILGGHYDSISNIPDESAPGADDNGSGIAVIVEAARRMSGQQFERTVRFVCFSGEETGLNGSAAYAARAAATGENIIGMFNLDSVGWNDDYFRIFSNASSAWLGDIAYNMAGTYAPTLTTYHWDCPGCTWSDHASFWTRGFDAICGIETWDPAPPHHHTPGDTLGLVDIGLVANVTNISLATISAVAGVDTNFAVTVASGEVPASWPISGYLYGAEPNPFNPSTNIRFFIPEELLVGLDIYSASGRLVRDLSGKRHPSGENTVTWNGRDDNDRQLDSGVYFIRMRAGDFVSTQKLVLLR